MLMRVYIDDFCSSRDAAKMLLLLLFNYDKTAAVTLCGPASGEVSIGAVGNKIAKAIGFEGEIVFDETKADGKISYFFMAYMTSLV